MALRTPCGGCGVAVFHPPCHACRRASNKVRDRTRGSAAARGYDAAWTLVRLRVLERDRHTCHYCGRAATSVDHIIPLSRGGARLDPSNLVAACVSCNSRKRDR